MTPLKGIFPLLALGLCLAAAGCGGDDEGKPIPAATATALQNQLDGVQARLDNGSVGACKDILEGPRGPNLDAVQQLIDGLPDDVDADVSSALEDSFDRLWELVQQECDDREPTDTTPTETETETEPETTPTETEPETTPTETEPQETTPTSPDEAPVPNDGDGDNSGGVPGNGNGNGNGGGAGAGTDPGTGE
jgi:hypothetical protein